MFEIGTNPNNPNALQYSADGREVSFEIDTTSFQAGSGTLEIKTFGGDTQPSQFNQPNSQFNQSPTSVQSGNNLQLKLYPAPPIISEVKAKRGDKEILMTGERLEQINSININGKRAIVKGNGNQAQVNSGNMGVGGGSGNMVQGANVFANNYPTGNQYSSQNPTTNQSPNQNQNQSSTFVNPNPVATNYLASQYQNISLNQRIVVFEDTSTRINADSVTLELNLDDNRYFNYPNRFPVGASRPAVKANDQNEIEGVFLNQSLVNIQNDQVMVTPQTIKPKDKRLRTTDKGQIPQLDLSNYPVVSVDKQAMTIAIQNILTDYNFRLENLSIETRIENATTNSNELPQIRFEVLDTNNLRLNFTFNQVTNKALSGRRLQFRIRDRERGNSDWLTIKQTFVRIPSIESVKCTNEMNNQCELKGEGLDYIGQVSTDGGRNWNNNNLQVQLTEDGKNKIMIPMLINQKFLNIKLRDFSNTEGLNVSNFVYSNSVKKVINKSSLVKNSN